MDIDEGIRDRIDRSFGDGPDRPAPDLLALGHRALRRRRQVLATAAAAVLVVVGGTTTLATGRSTAGPGPSTPFVAAPSSTTPTVTDASPAPLTGKQLRRALRWGLAEYDDSGHLKIDSRATLLHRIDNPFGLTGRARSVAVEIEFRGATYWVALFQGADGSGGGATTPAANVAPKTFETWVHEHRGMADGARTTPGADVWPGEPTTYLVRFSGTTERLDPVGRTRILEQRAHVSVGDSFAGPADRTAVAVVRTPDGQRYYVLARDVAGPAEYIAVPQSEGGPTMADFLELARTKYAEGGGGLL